MDIVGVATIAGGTASVLVALGITLNVPRGARDVYKKGKAWLDAPRQRRKELEQKVDILFGKVDALFGLVKDLEDSGTRQLNFHETAGKDVAELERRVESLTTLLSEARDQITDLRKAEAILFTGMAEDEAAVRNATAQLSDTIAEQAGRARTLEQRVEALEIASDPTQGWAVASYAASESTDHPKDMDELLTRIAVLEALVAQQEQRTGSRPVSTEVKQAQPPVVLQQSVVGKPLFDRETLDRL